MKLVLVLLVASIGCERPAGPSRPYGAEIFVRGTFFADKDAGWDVCEHSNQMTRVDTSKYEVSMPLKPGIYQFKIADKTWRAVNLGASGASGNVTIKNPTILKFADSVGNLEVAIENAGGYKFSLDAADRLHPTLVISPE
jgi:hypothetical protein